ncbi:MAG: hypothetical protein COB85_04310 [Bacteroidetes bacterium]|nr:MAG: hypothetical protein COB85_04310 [Bacteroidota bacterium]
MCTLKHSVIQLSLFLMCLFVSNPGSTQTLNGQFDDISELSTKFSVPFTMPDGIKLMTDIFLPIPQDCLMIDITIPGLGSNLLEFIPKGKQLVVYDSINGGINPNPYKLPIIFVRTPYDKEGADAAGVVSMFGYAFAYQDQRGRYSSEGVYLPIYSDGWNKNPYHANVKHVLDVTDLSDPLNGNFHEDGYNSNLFILDSLFRSYDLDNDGIIDTVDKMTHGIIGLFGASALGYNQFQAVAAHKTDASLPGVRCILPIVAPGEFYKSTGFQNGVFRDRLVTGWLKGQIFTGIEDDSISVDTDIQNTLHTSFDYNLNNKFDAANLAIDHFSVIRYTKENGDIDVAGYYPNSRGRADMDISRAAVNASGEGDTNGGLSRYTNMEVPAYNVSGWWDIFVDGQLETWAYMRKELKDSLPNKKLQKIVIGPWAHQTIGTRETGDMQYPTNVMDVIGNIEFSEDSVPISELLQTEILSWFRYNMNHVPGMDLGDPKFLIHKSNKWQVLVPGTIGLLVKIPAEDYYITFEEMLTFINGAGGLSGIKVEVKETLTGAQVYSVNDPGIDIPALGDPLIPGLDGEPILPIPELDFANDVPNVRFYVVGPNGDGIPDNDNVGNYWFSSDTFPLVNDIGWMNMYMHQNGTFTYNVPTSDEGYGIYVHDPDDPVLTIGGANMIVRTPQDDKDSQGQMNLADPKYAGYTMDRQGVLSYTSAPIADSMCVIGFPVATIYAKTNPGGVTSGPTDTDFFIRILDVYPDGREFFVASGCVNARAREYAKGLVLGRNGTNDYHSVTSFPLGEVKDSIDYIPYSNINIGQTYQYKFKMMPLAYTWGKDHKIKVLISSSNYTRYQVNPNLPLHDGDFFRRKPGDGRKYTFNGVEMEPRTAVQRISFSPGYPTNIDFPVFSPGLIAGKEEIQFEPTIDALIYPNPATETISVYMNHSENYQVSIINTMGQIVLKMKFKDHAVIPINRMESGIYYLRIENSKSKISIVKKVSIL